MNIVDFIIILLLLFFCFDGYRRGIIKVIVDIFIMLLTLTIAYVSTNPISKLFFAVDDKKYMIYQVVVLMILWVVLQALVNLLITLIFKKLFINREISPTNRVLGLLVSGLKILFIIYLFFIVLEGLPTKNSQSSNDQFVNLVNTSYSSQFATKYDNVFSKKIASITTDYFLKNAQIFGDKPIIAEQEDLGFVYDSGTIDTRSELEMFDSLNKERVKLGFIALTWDEDLAELARNQSQDMLQKGYFAHINKEKLSPFDRMNNAGIKFIVAGENLAFAPTVAKAHEGLMASPGHRENILSPDFQQVGIGVIDAGKYGKMFTQSFADLVK